MRKLHSLLIDLRLKLYHYERCAICGWFMFLHKVRDYYGGITDEETGKTHYVCMRCYDWFYNVKDKSHADYERVIRNSNIEWQKL